MDALVEMVESTSRLAIEYYLNDGDTRKKIRLQLMPMLDRIQTKINILQHHKTIPDFMAEYILLYDAITDTDFDSANLPVLPIDHKRLIRILCTAENLIYKAESWFCKTYKETLPCKKINMNGH